jgi:hypothetical protein
MSYDDYTILAMSPKTKIDKDVRIKMYIYMNIRLHRESQGNFFLLFTKLYVNFTQNI